VCVCVYGWDHVKALLVLVKNIESFYRAHIYDCQLEAMDARVDDLRSGPWGALAGTLICM
jgi:hypothetical protein